MTIPRYILGGLLALSTRAVATSCNASEPIRDVIIIGGGSAGTYAAIQLHDLNKTVAVIEPTGKLGGNADSYYDGKGGVFNAGVQILYDIPVVSNYFQRLGVPLVTAPAAAQAGVLNADFALGMAAPAVEVNTTAIGLAIQRYSAYLAANFSTVYPGYNLSDPVPEDLVMPWGDFMTKYGLDSIANLINQYIQPAEATLEPALYPLKLLGLDPVKGITSGFKVTPDVQTLYRSAAAVLGDSVHLNTTVYSVRRLNGSVEVTVQSAAGKTQVIRAKQLLMTAAPTLLNHWGWDLTNEESELFGKFKGQQYYAGIIRHTGLNESVTLQNVDFFSRFNIPKLPALFNVVPTGLGDHQFAVYYTSRDRVAPDVAKNDTVTTLDRLAGAGVIGKADTEILAWYDHPNVRMYVEAEDIRGGFYKDLYALQGQRNTYWSGAAWVTQASSPIWDYTKALVEEMVANAK